MTMGAGFAEIDITPKVFGRLGRLAVEPTQVVGIHLPLLARLAVFDDGERRAAILSLDMNLMFSQDVPAIRAAIAEPGGMKPEDIMVACTHTHNSFSLMPWHDDDDLNYKDLDQLCSLMPDLARDAVTRLETCTFDVGTIQVEGMTLNRRSCYGGDDGTVSVGTHGSHDADNFIGVEGPTDDELKVLLCRTTDGRVLGGIVNFAAHPISMFGEPVYSSSYIGPLVKTLQAEYGGSFTFLYGFSGNLCPAGNATGANANERIGTLLGNKAIEALANPVRIQGDEIGLSREIIPLPFKRVTTEQIRAAKRYQKMDPADVDPREMCRALYGHDYIFHSMSAHNVMVFNNEILGMWEFQRRSGRRNLTHDYEVQVIRVGGLAIAGVSSELFCEVKHELQEASPFACTFFASMANGGHGYIPTREGHSHGGLEASLSTACQFTEDACDMVKVSIGRQLRALRD